MKYVFPRILVIILVVNINLSCTINKGLIKDYNGCYEYYKKANRGYCYYLNSEIDSAIIYLTKAFNIRKQGCNVLKERNDHYILAKLLLKKGDITEGKEKLKHAVFYGGLNWTEILNDSIFKLIPSSNFKIEFKQTYDSLYAEWDNKIDVVLKKKVEEMVSNDQKYRLKVYDKNESIKIETLRALQKEVDSINEKLLEEIIENYGYPGYTKIGSNLSDILLLHTSDDFRKRIFPKLTDEIDKGEISPQAVAVMIDQMLFFSKKTQRYGSVFRRNVLGYREFVNFESNDKEFINENRRILGLTSLECVLLEKDINMPYFFDLKLELQLD